MARFSSRWRQAPLLYREAGVMEPRPQGPQSSRVFWTARQTTLSHLVKPTFCPGRQKPQLDCGSRELGSNTAAAKYMVHISRRRDAHIHPCTNHWRPQQTAFILISDHVPPLLSDWRVKGRPQKLSVRDGKTHIQSRLIAQEIHLFHNRERRKGTHQGRASSGAQNDRLHTDRAGYDKTWICTIHPRKAICSGWCPIWPSICLIFRALAIYI